MATCHAWSVVSRCRHVLHGGTFRRKTDNPFRNQIVPEMRTAGALYRFDTFCGELSRDEVLGILVANAEHV